MYTHEIIHEDKITKEFGEKDHVGQLKSQSVPHSKLSNGYRRLGI